jgi:hypothetical protein
MREFELGEVVEHRLHNEWLLVVDTEDEDAYLCRTKAMQIMKFYDFELKKKKR